MITIFGVDHSPWTQAAVLAHADQGVSVRIRPYPPLGYLLKSGLVMPACWHSDSTPTPDSLAIIQALLPPKDRAHRRRQETDFTELESLFLAYALDRTGPGRRLAFVRGWAGIRDVPLGPVSIAWRALICWYFFLLIELARWTMRKRLVKRSREERIRDRLAPWVARLEKSPFLGGDKPDASDFGLLGHMECVSSGLTDWAMRAAAEHPALLAWLQRMHARLKAHPALYSRRMMDVQSGPMGSGRVGQIWFFLWMNHVW